MLVIFPTISPAIGFCRALGRPESNDLFSFGWDSDGVIYDDVEVYDNVDEIMELLPPTQGFFFGSDDIDEWYKENIISTIKVLEDELKDENIFIKIWIDNLEFPISIWNYNSLILPYEIYNIDRYLNLRKKQ